MTPLIAATATAVALGLLLFALRKKPRAPRARRAAIDAPHSPAVSRSAEAPSELRDFTLLNEADPSRQGIRELQAMLQTMTLPNRSLHELVTTDILDEGASRRLCDLILGEPLLAARILARVNSSFFGLRAPVRSVQYAVTFLGLSAVRSMALRLMVEDSISGDSPARRALFANVWDAAMIASELCTRLGQKLGMRDSATSSTETVLSFIGTIATLTLLPGAEASAAWQAGLLQRTRIEQDQLGLNAMLAGALLMRNWSLPEEIVNDVCAMQRILVTPPERLGHPARARLALGFACAQIGERVARREVQDARDIDPRTLRPADNFFLQAYFELPEFARIDKHLRAPDIAVRVTRMIDALAESS